MLKNKHIITLKSHFIHDMQMYLIMEYAEGGEVK